ncbi:MAG: hypothetical protein IIV67_02155, partial [Bacteroidaceae bacterium]|nr:hypothetical protein [Bacteroidaceae bacterium]
SMASGRQKALLHNKPRPPCHPLTSFGVPGIFNTKPSVPPRCGSTLGSIVLLWYISLVRCIIGLTETEEWGSYPFFLEIGAPVPWAGSELSIPDH